MTTVEQEQTIIAELALLEGQRRWDETSDRLRYSVEYAQAGLKGLFLANGAAIIALLTFVGNTRRQVESVALWWSFSWFALGLAAVLAAYICAYVSQSEIMHAAFKQSRAAESAAFKTGQCFDPVSHEDAGNLAVIAGLWLAIAALGLFVLGAFVALDAIV